MTFDSTVFLFGFLPISFILYYVTPGKFKNLTLALLSVAFYAWGSPAHALVLLVSIIWNYIGGKVVSRARRKAKNIVFIIVGVDILLLFSCKYTGRILEIAGNGMADNRFLLVPIGVSFFMLQNISYIIDIYRGDTRPQQSIVNYAVLIAMFPKVVAGPLVSGADFEVQLTGRKLSAAKFSDGVLIFVRGLAKKVILGEAMYTVYQTVAVFPKGEISVMSAWLGCIAFALQMYFSFGGYCDMAIGLGRMLGFELPDNVDHPCMATGIMDFWSRWMTTLWKWFCSYVYLPLCAGNPVGSIGFLSLLVTWSLIGLWHGLNFTFVIWGIYFAILLFMEGFVLREAIEKIPGVIRWIFTTIFLMISWVFFFSTSVGEAVSYMGRMFGIGSHGLIDARALSVLVSNGVLWIAGILVGTPVFHIAYDKVIQGHRRWQIVVNCIVYALLFILCIAAVVSGTGHEMFYFRF